jgi:hypothetical protein
LPAVDARDDEGVKPDVPLRRLVMIVRFYHPQLSAQAASLETAVKQYSSVVEFFAEAGKAAQEGPFPAVESAHKALIEAIEQRASTQHVT